jgi:hypothetical protein
VIFFTLPRRAQRLNGCWQTRGREHPGVGGILCPVAVIGGIALFVVVVVSPHWFIGRWLKTPATW